MMFKISSENIEEFIEKQHAIDGMVSMHDFELWLEEQPRVGEWIPCSEKLPEELIPVNVTWVNRKPPSYYKDIKDKPFTATAIYYKKQWFWWSPTIEDRLSEYGLNGSAGLSERLHPAIEITAWMPLPEPYREGE